MYYNCFYPRLQRGMPYEVPLRRRGTLNPHFSPSFCCGGGSGHVYCVALPRAPRHTVKYACGALRRAPCIHARLRRLATKDGEKCGLIVCGDGAPARPAHPWDFLRQVSEKPGGPEPRPHKHHRDLCHQIYARVWLGADRTRARVTGRARARSRKRPAK
jgi:hypothetical protein